MKKILLLLISVMGVQMVNAQKGYGTVTYSAATPLGDMTNYIDKVSYRGINAELYWHIKQNFDAGVEVGWNVFNNREDKKTYTEETRSITGVQYRYVNAVPIIAGLRWGKTGGNLQP